MQSKTTTKIVIDKLKLDLLLRIGCSKEIIFDAICYQKITKTGDAVLDELLECFLDINTFKNWGGRRKGAGRKIIQVENQDDNQLENQDLIKMQNKNKNKKENINTRVNISSLSTMHVSKFTPPTLQEVLEYAKQQTDTAGMGGFSCPRKIAEEFWTHYDSQGWVKSNDSRTPVINWKSLLRSWTLNPNKFSKVGVAAPADYDLPL